MVVYSRIVHRKKTRNENLPSVLAGEEEPNNLFFSLSPGSSDNEMWYEMEQANKAPKQGQERRTGRESHEKGPGAASAVLFPLAAQRGRRRRRDGARTAARRSDRLVADGPPGPNEDFFILIFLI